MRGLSFSMSLLVLASVSVVTASTGGEPSARADRAPQLAQAEEERVGQDPDPRVEKLPADEEDKRVGNDPDVPGGSAPGTPESDDPPKRIGNDPDVPVEGGPFR